MWLKTESKKATDEQIEQFEAQNKVRLPASYRALLKEQNGGFIKKNHLKTSEPTSYGINFLEIYQIFGIDNLITEPQAALENPLSGHYIYFSKDGARFIGFDYHTEEPSIFYADFETLQTLTIASDFDSFQNQLYFEPFEIQQAPSYGQAKLDQMLLQADFKTRVEILALLEDEAEKTWYLTQLKKLILAKKVELAYPLFENQILYFRRKLPEGLVLELFELLKASDIDLTALQREWKGE